MVFHDKKRCHCHKPRHKRPSLILACDIFLGLMAAVFIIFLLYIVILPRLGVKIDIGFIINSLHSGMVFMVILLVSNLAWAIYYGCQKSKAGVLLALLTTVTVMSSYFLK
jgi:hypothetical protein